MAVVTNTFAAVGAPSVRHVTAAQASVGKYYFLFDTFTQESKYAPMITRVEGRIHTLGLVGRSERFTMLKNIREMVHTAIQRGAETIVVVGNDHSISRVIPYLGDEDVTLGIIPLGTPNRIAQILGVPEGEAACDVLSRRVTKKVDLGKVNDQYFLFSLDAPEAPVTIECDGQYKVSATEPGRSLSICNLGNLIEFDANHRSRSNPEDGRLEAVVTAQERGMFRKGFTTESVFPIKRAVITCPTESVSLVIDGQTIVKTPATVEVVPHKLKLIVGKDRLF
jgi:diacylglycerol kinase family enzyme